MIGGKIIKSGGAEPDDFEKQIGQALLELEMNSDLKQQLRELYITRAREIEFGTKKVRHKKSSKVASSLKKSFSFRPSSFTFQFQSKRLSKRFKLAWCVSWRRNSQAVMSCSVLNEKFFPNPNADVQIQTNKRDQEAAR